MKTYEEMIQFTVDQDNKGYLQYVDWVTSLLLSEAYGVPRDTVYSDLTAEKEHRVNAKKLARKAQSRVENEARRLANIQRAQNEQV